MSLQFAQFDAGVIAFGAFVWFFVCVAVAGMTCQLSGCGETARTEFTIVRLDAGVGIDVILLGRKCLESTFAHRTFWNSKENKI